ncbi:DUF6886 family protein [Fictibacillus barbaricus]|uniref:Uncharacterized protein n=1 Tax=Fictibacillus barbaricus TaxID=182136 RepID=A0ABU1U619_9BACL|nr:DUF6886 family protein [Fictibacillus barbaricus]MDR7074918.1 hypothetical protein [Fictibacillus barbaricus]
MLYHFSEEKHIEVFVPRKHPSFPDRPPMVWAIDKERSPLYLLPRDCPRIGFWATPETTQSDREKYLHMTSAQKIMAVESGSLDQIQNTKLFRYSLSDDHFVMMDEGAGYYVSYETEVPLKVEEVGSLLDELVQERIEIRIVPSLQPLYEQLPTSTLHYSMIRMRNSKIMQRD